MNFKPKVSVIMPSLNVLPYIHECMNSVIHQTLKEIEIICVDAGSEDGTLEILQEYAREDDRIKLIVTDKKSYGYQMNAGISTACGEYIGIVETDDYISLNMYEELYHIAKEHSLDFVKADFNRFTVNGDGSQNLTYNRLSWIPSYYNRIITPIDEVITFRFIMNTWSGIYRRDFLNKNQISHNETPGASYQDNGFWFQTFALAERAMFVNKPYYMNRRDNPNSSVHNRAKIYCIGIEYDYIRDFLERDVIRKNKLIHIYSFLRYRNYVFTLNRIADEYKLEFLQRFRDDFVLMMEQGEVLEETFTEQEWSRLRAIMSDPEGYYDNLIKKKTELKNLINGYDNIIIYGAGAIGKQLLSQLLLIGESLRIVGFAVTQQEGQPEELMGVPVRAIYDLYEYKTNSVVLIATTEIYHKDILETLTNLGFLNIVPITE